MRTKKILILVEKDLQKRWAPILKNSSYHIIFKNDPQRAAEEILSSPPELLVLQESLNQVLIWELIKALKNNLNLSFLPILMVLKKENLNKDWFSVPADDFLFEEACGEEILSRIQLAFARAQRSVDNNPLTGLPGNTTILRAIQEKINAEEEVAVAYVDLDHFKPFNDRYGFARGDEILRMVARILSNVVLGRYGAQGFVGHIGGDDFVFICPLKEIEKVCQEIIKDFAALLPNFIDPKDWNRGYFEEKDRQGKKQRFSFPSLSIAVVPLLPGRFKHYGEVSAVAAQIKKMAKGKEGNSFFIDRRRQPYETKNR